MKAIGKQTWAIADGYIPGWSNGIAPQMISHEALCILNTNDVEALVRLYIYFSDKDPIGPFSITVPAKRTKHIRINDLNDPEPIPHGVDYACTLESSVPVVVQHTRFDSRQCESGLFSTIAFGA